MNHTPSLLLPQNNKDSYILLQNFPLKMPEILININFTSQPPRWEAPSPPGKAEGAAMCHSPHTTQGAAAELATGTDPGLPFCAQTTRSSNVTQLLHLLTKPLLIITSVYFPRESLPLSGCCSVTGSPKSLWKRWAERGTTEGPQHTAGSSLYMVKCPAHYASSSLKWELR